MQASKIKVGMEVAFTHYRTRHAVDGIARGRVTAIEEHARSAYSTRASRRHATILELVPATGLLVRDVQDVAPLSVSVQDIVGPWEEVRAEVQERQKQKQESEAAKKEIVRRLGNAVQALGVAPNEVSEYGDQCRLQVGTGYVDGKHTWAPDASYAMIYLPLLERLAEGNES